MSRPWHRKVPGTLVFHWAPCFYQASLMLKRMSLFCSCLPGYLSPARASSISSNNALSHWRKAADTIRWLDCHYLSKKISRRLPGYESCPDWHRFNVISLAPIGEVCYLNFKLTKCKRSLGERLQLESSKTSWWVSLVRSHSEQAESSRNMPLWDPWNQHLFIKDDRAILMRPL